MIYDQKDAHTISRTFAKALAHTSLHGPNALTFAVDLIKTDFSFDPEEREVVEAFIKLLKVRAARKEAALRKAFWKGEEK